MCDCFLFFKKIPSVNSVLRSTFGPSPTLSPPLGHRTDAAGPEEKGHFTFYFSRSPPLPLSAASQKQQNLFTHKETLFLPPPTECACSTNPFLLSLGPWPFTASFPPLPFPTTCNGFRDSGKKYVVLCAVLWISVACPVQYTLTRQCDCNPASSLH